MKRYLLVLLAAGAVAAFAGIEWRVHDKPIIRIDYNDGLGIELGLRDDGVVVWRKITQTTNSPAEMTRYTNIYVEGDYTKWMTNITLVPPLTNGIYDDLIPKVR